MKQKKWPPYETDATGHAFPVREMRFHDHDAHGEPQHFTIGTPQS